MTKNKTLLFFFALVFGFCAFSDGVWDGPVRVCSELECNSLKEYLNMIYRLTNETYNDIDRKREDLWYANQNIKRYVSNLDNDQPGLLAGLNYETGAIDTLTTQMGYSINYWNATSGGYGTQFREYIDHIDCSLCSNGQCIDMTVVTNILSQVTAINTNILNLSSNLDSSFNSVTNYLRLIRNSVYEIEDSNAAILSTLEDDIIPLCADMVDLVTDIDALMLQWSNWVQGSYLELKRYLHFLDSLPNISTNLNVNVDFLDQGGYLSDWYWHALVMQDFSNFYDFVLTPDDWSYPFGSPFYDESMPLYTYIVSGFANLMQTQVSLNNYFYWLRQHLLSSANSNDLSRIEAGLASLTNIASRLDSYALGDFSNKFNDVWRDIGSLVSNSLYNASIVSNLTEIVDGVNTNNLYLSSIDSKLDVLDYIKILSTTPLSSYSGDSDYFEYLTNLYISGSADSGGVSTNWFERMEILLASLVFGDSDGTNDIPQGVEMEGFDAQALESALTDYTFTEDFTSAVGNLETTSQNFMQVLNGYHNAIKSVSLPASVSIGIGGLNGEDTHDFNDMMHGHFQVSFSVGASDRFTVVVRAVTTMCWVLLTLIFIWHCGFWICSKIQFFYRLMRLLINSIWLRS